MTALLRLDCSVSGERSRSRLINGAVAVAWAALGPDHRVVSRDLFLHPPALLPSASVHFPAGLVPGDRPDAFLAQQTELIDELLTADVLLVAVPLYNYSVPTTLHAWIDHVHVVGRTAGLAPEDLPLRGKPAVLVSTRGAAYGGADDPQEWDHATAALEVVLGASMGMRTERIVAQLTLADAVPPLAPRLPEAEASLDAALARARELAASLG
jgi:FMN-dependent NADH-azoreductase